MSPLEAAIDEVLDHRQGCATCSRWWWLGEGGPCPDGVVLHDLVREAAARRDAAPDLARWRR